jgi:hypothetical protein
VAPELLVLPAGDLQPDGAEPHKERLRRSASRTASAGVAGHEVLEAARREVAVGRLVWIELVDGLGRAHRLVPSTGGAI